MSTIHTLVFADPEASSWGAYWLPAEEGSASLGYQGDGGSGLVTAELSAPSETEPWRLGGDHASLAFTPSGPSARGGSVETGVDSWDQLCAVSGTVTVAGRDHEIDCVGWRARTSGDFDLPGLDSVRQAYGWFDQGDGVAAVALRPRKSKGQDADLIAAAVLEPEPTPRVEDPRLSSTYDAAGVPTRVGLELWFEEEPSAEGSEDDEERRFPRRAAGEAIGDPLQWHVGEFQLQALPLRWHSHGSDGIGIYLLGRRE